MLRKKVLKCFGHMECTSLDRLISGVHEGIEAGLALEKVCNAKSLKLKDGQVDYDCKTPKRNYERRFECTDL